MDTADAGLPVRCSTTLVPAGGRHRLRRQRCTVARLGASALMAAALAQRRDATGDDRYDDELRALGRFMTGQITARGPDAVGLSI